MELIASFHETFQNVDTRDFQNTKILTINLLS